jgi:hypothetical protein
VLCANVGFSVLIYGVLQSREAVTELLIFLVGTTVSHSSSTKFYENKEQQQVLGGYILLLLNRMMTLNSLSFASLLFLALENLVMGFLCTEIF